MLFLGQQQGHAECPPGPEKFPHLPGVLPPTSLRGEFHSEFSVSLRSALLFLAAAGTGELGSSLLQPGCPKRGQLNFS